MLLVGAAVVSAAAPTLPAHTYTTGSSYGSASTAAAYGYSNGFVSVAKFKGPWGVAYDPSTAGVVVTDYYDDRIRRISSGGLVSTFAGSGVSGAVDGTGENARFYYPAGCTVTSGGVAYIADKSNHNIRGITASGNVTTLAGSGSAGAANGVAARASFSSPYGVASFNDTAVYVADSGNDVIRRVVFADGAATTHSGSGYFGRVDGSAANCSFKYPYGVAASSAGVVYVADKWAQAIRKVSIDGWTTTLAGSHVSAAGNVDATGSAARFDYPYDVSVGAGGYVFVADSGNNAVRTVSPAGAVTTAHTATVAAPRGVHVTTAGNLYITSYNSEQVSAYTGGALAQTPAPAVAASATTAAPVSAGPAVRASVAVAVVALLSILA
jgi:hypothetical protein